MKSLKLLGCAVLAHLATLLASASAPASIGDSFINFSYDLSGRGISGTGLFYFGPDGTCRQVALSSLNSLAGETLPTYDMSRTGTYTYALSSSDPNQAAVAVTMAGPGTIIGYFFTLEFATTSTGTLELAPQNQNGPLALYIGTFSYLPHLQNNFLANVSNRVDLRPTDTAISGFVIQGTTSKLVLVRVVGPTLTQFGVSPASQHPQLNLFQGTGTTQIASGAVWDSNAFNTGGYDTEAMSWIFSMVGAFSLQSGSADVTYFGLLSPGSYTAQSFDSTTPLGGASALTEVYILPYSG